MFGDGSLTIREFAMKEPLPLATVQEAVLEFLRHREDAALFEAQAVNAYVDEPRMTQDVDVMSRRAEGRFWRRGSGWRRVSFRPRIRKMRDGMPERVKGWAIQETA